MKIPPWLSYWVTEHWFVTSILIILALASVYGLLRAFAVNFLKIFHKRQINVKVSVESNADPDTIGNAIREQLEQLPGFQPRQRDRGDERESRFAALDDDDDV